MFKKYLYLKNSSDFSACERGKEGKKAPENKMLSLPSSELHRSVSEVSF